METTRRRFLTYGLGGVALLLVPGLGLSLRKSILTEPRAPLVTLSPRQYSTLSALADTMCPGGEGLPTAADLDVAGALDQLWARMHPGTGADLGAALDLLENALAGALLDGRFQTFTACAPDLRAQVLLDWAHSAIGMRRAVFKALRGFVMAAYWGNPRTQAVIEYRGMPDYSGVPSPPPFAEYIAGLDAGAGDPDTAGADTAGEQAQ
jgi:hypothetical protein